MNMMIRDRRPELSHRLLNRLRPMVAGKLDVGMHPYGGQLFAYCCFDRERMAALRLDCPMICVVLYGQKDVWLGDRTRSFTAGSLFILPGGVPMDVVNIPDDKTGVYAALRLDVPCLPEGIPPLSIAERAGSAVDLDSVEPSVGHDQRCVLGAEASRVRTQADVLARGVTRLRHDVLGDGVQGLSGGDGHGRSVLVRRARVTG